MTHAYVPLIMMLGTLLCLATAAGPALRLYVATNGDDGWSGRAPAPNRKRSDGPFATIERARDELRALRRAEKLAHGAVVTLRSGAYYLERPFTLTSEDSGAPGAPIVYRSAQRGKVRLSGGRIVSGFKPYRGQIVQLDLKPLGLSPGQLFFNGERQVLARWPNLDAADPHGTWIYVAGVAEPGSGRRFKYSGDRPHRWAHPEDAQVSIFPNYNWHHMITDIAAINREHSVITLARESPYEILPGRRYFYQNVFEELDAPGEWFFDRRTGILYFWPPSPVERGTVVLPAIESVVEIENVEHVRLQGFVVECCSGDGVRVRGGSDCLVGANTVRNTGRGGIIISGGTANGAVGNDIYFTAGGGISLSGGDRPTLTPARNYADNNHIHHFARTYLTYHIGIAIEGVGNRVSHNLIHDTPHIAIMLSGNEHVIEYNEIHHVCMETADCGGFYIGRDWTQRGNVLRYNKFHDIYGYGLVYDAPDAEGVYHYDSPQWAWGVYLDDCSSGVAVYGNLFYRVPLCGVMLGGGRDNLVENNIFVDCVPAYHIDARWDAYCWDIMEERLAAMNYTQPPFSERYPELLDMGDARTPANNRFLRNIVSYRRDDFRGLATTRPDAGSAAVYDLAPFDPETCVFDFNTIHHFGQPIRVNVSFYKKERGGLWTWEQWRTGGFDRSSIVADPLFVDPGRDDYRLRPESPAFGRGFKRIPVEKIGLYRSPLRASWPVAPDARKGGAEWARQTIPIPLAA